MKHIKTFESAKETSTIEDLLLFFVDSGEINGVAITEFKPCYSINFKVNSKIVGLDKLKLMDKIINRLKRKYQYIYINNNKISIDKKDDGEAYITISLYDKVDTFMKDKLLALKKFKKDDTVNLIYYGLSKDKLVFAYYGDGILFVDHDSIWMYLKDNLMIENSDIRVIIKHYVSNILKIDVDDINVGLPQRPTADLYELDNQ